MIKPGLTETSSASASCHGMADDVAAVVLNNMKTMVGMAYKEAPTSVGAPDELRLMQPPVILHRSSELERRAKGERATTELVWFSAQIGRDLIVRL